MFTALWFAASAAGVVLLSLSVSKHVSDIALLLTRRPLWADVLYAVLFLPGVALHEASHFVMATLLGVRVHEFSLRPHRPKDHPSLVLGYIKSESADPFRSALIGIAPLLVGSLFVLWMGYTRLNVPAIGEALAAADLSAAWAALLGIGQVPNIGVWLYLTFVVSNTLLPSPSDWHAWPTVLLILSVLAVLVVAVGAGPLVASWLAPFVLGGMQTLAVAFSIVIVLDLAIVPVLWAIKAGLENLLGIHIVSIPVPPKPSKPTARKRRS